MSTAAMQGRPLAPAERVILALDLPSETEALAWAARFRGRVGMYKIGLQLFTAAGPALVSRIASQFGPVFLDLKLHDIPNTVASAVRSAGTLGVSMLTVHASGGTAMLRAASQASSQAAGEAAAQSSRPGTEVAATNRIRIVAVTVLTSLSQADLAAGGVARSVRGQVLALAECAWLSGCDGVVASPLEAAPLRGRFGPDLIIVTPGIRAADAPADDQSRTASPREAVAAGADYLVIGRPILASPDPEEALDRILASLA